MMELGLPEDLPKPRQDEIREVTASGSLYIYLGYAIGVGKTYAMLEAAHSRLQKGEDVVIGCIETHERLEAELLAAGIPGISDMVKGGGQYLDLDALLERKPGLAVVDDLAFTNPPGMRHPRRYQDVEELLLAGIDVFTTLNIQHLESLNDVVFQITGVVVTETIPDRLLDQAAEIVLVDLPPDELLARMEAGKVDVSQTGAKAIANIFRKGNLTALREMTLRRAAERVDEQMRDYMQVKAIPGPWPAAERLIVCVNPPEGGERLVRAARRLAGALNAEWMAVYVDTPDGLLMPRAWREQVRRSMLLAEELGGRTATLTTDRLKPSLASAVLDFARKSNVTRVIAARPTRRNWRNWLRPSLADELIDLAAGVDVFVIASDEKKRSDEDESGAKKVEWARYLISLALVTAATLINAIIGNEIAPANLVMVYLLSVVLAAVYLGRGPSILAAIASVLAFDFFFVPPFHTFSVADTEYILTFFGFLLVGTVISWMTLRAQNQAEAARRRARDTQALLSLNREISQAEDLGAVIRAAETQFAAVFEVSGQVFLADSKAGTLMGVDGLVLNDQSAANWAFEHMETTGQGTKTLAAAGMRYYPMRSAGRKIGVLGITAGAESLNMIDDQQVLLDGFIQQISQAIAQFQLLEADRQVKLMQMKENLQNALLNSISHDLRTPLATITGALSTLDDQADILRVQDRADLIQTARGEAARLNRLVGNLLDMSRLEAGALRLRRDVGDLQDLAGAVFGKYESRLAGRDIRIDIPPDLPAVEFDFVLMMQVLTNLLDNGLKYSQPGSPLTLEASAAPGEVHVRLMDRGIGIPQEDLARVFDKFFRVQRTDQATGSGLGLAICKGIVEAHGGRIWAEARPGGGTTIAFSLPVKGVGG